jgi:hypothetical protein
MGNTQTKRRDDCPRCGGEVYVLTLGIAQVWAMVGAIATGHHGVRQNQCLHLTTEVEKKLDLAIDSHNHLHICKVDFIGHSQILQTSKTV